MIHLIPACPDCRIPTPRGGLCRLCAKRRDARQYRKSRASVHVRPEGRALAPAMSAEERIERRGKIRAASKSKVAEPIEHDLAALRLIDELGPMSQTEVAEYLGVVKERVRQIEITAMRKLQRDRGVLWATLDGFSDTDRETVWDALGREAIGGDL